MAFPSGGPFFPAQQPQPFNTDAQFDIFEWHEQFQSCQRYFLDHAQHSGPVQAVAAFLNIKLPYQKQSPQAIFSSTSSGGSTPAHPHHHGLHSPAGFSSMPGPSSSSMSGIAAGKMPMSMIPPPNPQQYHPQQQQQQQQQQQAATYTTLAPYIRRLVATGFDNPGILHGFFGDDWLAGIGPLHEAERRNYLFAAKSDNWQRVKASYDMDGEQMIPFLKPLQNVSEKEIVSAETCWSEWLAMQDWMLGPRAPIEVEGGGAPAPEASASQHQHHHQHQHQHQRQHQQSHGRGSVRIKMEE